MPAQLQGGTSLDELSSFDASAQPAPARRGLGRELVAMLVVWLVLSLVFALLTARDLAPLSNRAVLLPITALIGGVVASAFVWKRWHPWWLAAASAGYLAAWVVLMLRTSLQGTPVAFGGHTGDAGRLAALATRYSVTPWPADAFVPGLTGEYPPLLPWLAGRTGALLGKPGWQLLGDWEIVFASATVIVGFLLWRYLVSPWTALAVTTLVVGLSFSPPKAFSVISLIAFIPLVLAVFARPERGRMHWLAAGIATGLIVLTYWGWFVLAGIGVVIVLVRAWRMDRDRRGYLLYLAKVLGVALVVASWFVVPLVHGMLTNWGPSTGDTYGIAGQHGGLFPFLELTPIGILQLVGLVGLIWLRRSQWWACPLLALAVGAYAFRVLGMVYFFFTNHSLLFYYTERVYSAVFAAAGVLVLAYGLKRLASRFGDQRLTELTAAGLAIAVIWAGWGMTNAWMPGTGGWASGYARAAYAEPLPDGTYTTNGLRLPVEERTEWYPAALMDEAVKRVRGQHARPMTLSYHESLHVYLPWPGYLGQDRGASANGVRWDERFAELMRLAQTPDPAAFAAASAGTKFGGIDVFALRKTGDAWEWTAHFSHNMPESTVRFTAAQFSSATWEVVHLPNNYVVAIRR